ncbi:MULTISPECIES: LemA family protein [unclassified Porphyromonas]|uniref:LemA family protein n=1 Tax=unclassified Porphyromonas TaxID=2645799 RepID=UPI00052DCF14|nr:MULTISPECIES: LemA family protein [unclassified Porphyromonas]KGN83159.1 LemA family protein [Porphyromonas sp. COT-290 OH860]KGO00845.1 LemA family protein [Porphyromonas sp. COT-290 OH3588]
MNKKFALIGLVVLAIVALAWGVSLYNGFVQQEEEVNTAWSQVENQYQRRADLIPNLVATVKGYAAHEQETLQAVVEARSKATSTTIDANNMDEAALAQFQRNQDALSSALSRLMVVVEKYPELKANENFMALQSQLEGTENRITVARRDFNEAAKKYNTGIRRFPSNLVASIAGFDKRPYFEAQAGSEVAPTVDFGK